MHLRRGVVSLLRYHPQKFMRHYARKSSKDPCYVFCRNALAVSDHDAGLRKRRAKYPALNGEIVWRQQADTVTASIQFCGLLIPPACEYEKHIERRQPFLLPGFSVVIRPPTSGRSAGRMNACPAASSSCATRWDRCRIWTAGSPGLKTPPSKMSLSFSLMN